MKIQLTDKEIPAYAFRDRDDIREAVITDSVQVIGEGAFYQCHNLTHVTVGCGVLSVRMAAFLGIGRNADIVWLSETPYLMSFYRILLPMERIGCICAPHRDFARAGSLEKNLLAAGYILHPEFENFFSQKEMYVRFILEELPEHLGLFAEKNLLISLLRGAAERGLIADLQALHRYVSQARTRIISADDKKIIDGIEERYIRRLCRDGEGSDPNGFAGYSAQDNGSSDAGNAGGSDDFAGDYREV